MTPSYQNRPQMPRGARNGVAPMVTAPTPKERIQPPFAGDFGASGLRWLRLHSNRGVKCSDFWVGRAVQPETRREVSRPNGEAEFQQVVAN